MTFKTRSIETLLMEIKGTVTVRRQFEFTMNQNHMLVLDYSDCHNSVPKINK